VVAGYLSGAQLSILKFWTWRQMGILIRQPPRDIISRCRPTTAAALLLTAMRSFLPRWQILRTVAPRQAVAPLLPISRVRLGSSPLTHSPRPANGRLFSHFPARLNQPLTTPQSNPMDDLPPNSSLSQRLKHLIKSYGWYALGVYTVFTVLDFTVAFVGVNLLGAEYVSGVVASLKQMVFSSKPAEPGRDEMEAMSSGQGGNEGLYAMIVLAYTIHKTLFFPFRVGLTAAFTPRLVGWLRQRGWAGSSGARRAATEMKEKIKERRSRNSQD